MTSPTAPAAPPAEPAAPAPAATVEPFAANAPATETTQPEATETQESAPPAATEPAKVPTLEELDDDALLGNDRVKSLINRRAEADRQRSEREATDREAAARRQYAASTEFVRDFEGYARELATRVDEAGNVTLDQGRIDRMYRTMLTAGAEQSVESIGRLFGQEVGADFTPTAEEQELLSAARSEFNRDPIANAGVLARQWLRMRDRAVLASREAEQRRTVETEVRREFEAKATEERARQTREETRATTGPAPTAGAPASGAWGSQRQIDSAHARGDLSTDAYRTLLVTGTYGRLPH